MIELEFERAARNTIHKSDGVMQVTRRDNAVVEDRLVSFCKDFAVNGRLEALVGEV